MGLSISIGSGNGIAGKLVAMLFGLVFAVVGGFFVVMTTSSLLETIAMQHWQETPCTISLNKMQEFGESYELVLRYTYSFDGQTYTAERYSSEQYFISESIGEIDRMQKALPVGKQSHCFVDPQQPEEAVLIKPSVIGGIAGVGFSMLFASFGLLFAALPWLGRRKGNASPSTSIKSTGSPKKLLIAFGLIFAVVGGLMIKPFLITPLQKTRDAQNWDVVPATVISSKVKSHDSDDGVTYSVYIAYRYEIDGTKYVGDRYTFMGGSSSGYESKAETVRQYPEGREFQVYVNPSDPGDSVIKRNYSTSLLFGLIPVLFTGVGIGIVVAGVRHKKPALDTTQSRTQIVQLNHRSPRAKATGISLFTALWLGIVYFLTTSDAPLLFPVVFGFFGLIMLGASCHAVLATFNPKAVVEITPGNIHPETNVAMRWRLDGRIDRIGSLSITLKCLKITTETHRRGGESSTTTIKKPLVEKELLQTENQHEIAQGTLRFSIPDEQPASRPGNDSGIEWQVVFNGDIARWPNMKQEMPFTVYPND